MMRVEDQPRLRARSLGGRRASLGLFFILIVSLLGWHSMEHCDGLAIFGPGGRIGGVVFFEGDVWLVMTNISAGEHWTAQTVSASPQDGESLRHLLTRGTPAMPPRWAPSLAERGRFFVASQRKDAFGIPGKWCSAAGAPVWVLLPLGIWPLATWSFRRGRLWRRNRRGWCRQCGYDLQGVQPGARCPECGEIATRARFATAREIAATSLDAPNTL